MHVAETQREGRVSRNFDIGLSSRFIAFRKMDFQKKIKKIQKLPFFTLKMKLGPKSRI